MHLIIYEFRFRYLDLLFDYDKGGPVRLQDFKDICDAMSLTPQGIESLTNFLMNNIERILRTIPTGESIVTYMYMVLASKVALDSEIVKVRIKLNLCKNFNENFTIRIIVLNNCFFF